MSAGLFGQMGFKTEVTWATPVTVDKFHGGYLSDNPVREQPPLVSQGIRAGRRMPTCVSPGKRTVRGPFKLELAPAPLASLSRHMLGTINTTGVDPYTHAGSIGPLNGKSFTTQVGVPGTGGVVHPLTFFGCKLPGWAVKAAAGAIATLDLDVSAKDYVTGTALAAASYATSSCPFTFVHGSVSVDGDLLAEVKSFELAVQRPLRIEHYTGSLLIAEQLEMGRAEGRVKVETEFADLTIHDLGNTTVAVILAFDNGAGETLEITTNAFVEPTTPVITGVDGLSSFNISSLCHGSTDAAALGWELVNHEASAA